MHLHVWLTAHTSQQLPTTRGSLQKFLQSTHPPTYSMTTAEKLPAYLAASVCIFAQIGICIFAGTRYLRICLGALHIVQVPDICQVFAVARYLQVPGICLFPGASYLPSNKTEYSLPVSTALVVPVVPIV